MKNARERLKKEIKKTKNERERDIEKREKRSKNKEIKKYSLRVF